MKTTKQTQTGDSNTVFALRREGRLDEALEMGRDLFKAGPADVWVIRALGWVLYDLVKQALQAGDRAKAGQFVEEFEALPIEGADELLTAQRTRLCEQVSPHGAILAQASADAKAGNYPGALALYRQAVKDLPDSVAAQNGLGWELARALKAEARESDPDAAKVKDLLREYLRLTHIEKPSVLHSLVLAHATHLQGCLESLYPSFVRKWGPENLREEDYQSYKPEGKDETYPGLAEKMGMALGKSLKGVKRAAIPEGIDPVWISEVLGKLFHRFPDQIWIPYHYAKSLLFVGSLETARATLLPIVRVKQSEFWVWSALADTFESGAKDRLACLCRASLCKVQNVAFLQGVLRNLQSELEVAGEHDAANQLSQQQGPDIDPLLLKKLTPVFERYAPQANTLVFQDLPWANAILAGRIEPKADIKGAVFVLVEDAGGRVEVRVGSRKFRCLENARVGAPVSVRLIMADHRQQVVDARVREGQPWDLIPEQVGVVKHVNLPKRLAAIALGVDATTLAHFDRFPGAEAWAPGEVVAVRCQKVHQDALPVLVAVRRSDGMPSSAFCKRYEGPLNLSDRNSFGFVGDVYVHGAFINQAPVAGVPVHGVAVLDTNQKTGRKGWKALTFHINP